MRPPMARIWRCAVKLGIEIGIAEVGASVDRAEIGRAQNRAVAEALISAIVINVKRPEDIVPS